MFANILDALKEVKDTMATKEFVNAKFESQNDRTNRIEEDLKDSIKASTKAHVELEAASIARHSKSEAAMEKLETKMMGKIQTIQEQQASDQKELRQVRTGRINLLLVAALSVVGNLVVYFVSSGGLK